MIILATFIYYCTVVLRAIRWDKEINDIHIRAEEAKLSLSFGSIVLYVENPKEYTGTHTKTHIPKLIHKPSSKKVVLQGFWIKYHCFYISRNISKN